jgi:lactate permease
VPTSWTQNYEPFQGLAASGLAAAMPVLVLGYALGVARTAAWKASAYALLAASVVALAIYRMPVAPLLAAAGYGAVFGLFAIGWIVFAAILLFDVVVATGRFATIRNSLAAVRPDARIQVLLVAFAFGAFLEGASGAGTPVAVTASLLVGLGFAPLLAGGLCLLANTAPVAFGALGLPILTLAAVTELPVMSLSAAAGRISPLLGLIIPAYLVVVFAGLRGAFEVGPAVIVCGVTFAVTQFLASNFIGPQLADILSALVAIAAIVLLLKVWRPTQISSLPDGVAAAHATEPANRAAVMRAWMPYMVLVVLVLFWGAGGIQRYLDRPTIRVPVPALHNVVIRVVPAVPVASRYPAVFVFNWLGANGTACFLAAMVAALFGGLGWRRFATLTAATARRLALPELTIAMLMAVAYVMNYAGLTATLGLVLAASGAAFPFFSSYLGWLGVFLTGSDTSSNALFGNLQVVSARAIGINPVLTAAVNTTGGVMGKMISVASIAVAAAATGLPPENESKLFRFTVWHSVLLTGVIGLLALFYAYVAPELIPVASVSPALTP